MTRIGHVIVRSKMCDNGKLCGFVDVVEPDQSPSPCRPLPSLLASCFLLFPHLPLFSSRLYPYLISFPSAKVICVGHAVGFFIDESSMLRCSSYFMSPSPVMWVAVFDLSVHPCVRTGRGRGVFRPTCRRLLVIFWRKTRCTITKCSMHDCPFRNGEWRGFGGRE